VTSAHCWHPRSQNRDLGQPPFVELRCLAKDGGWGLEAGKFFEEAVGELEGCGGDVLFDVGDGGSAGDGEHYAGTGEEPRESHLHGGGFDFSGDASEQIVRLAILSQRGPGDKGDSVFFAVVEEIVPFAVGKAVSVLDGDDGDDLASALEVFESDVGERCVLNFALRAEVGEALHGRVERNGGVGNVELVDGDAVEAEALEAAFDGFAEVIRACVVDPLGGSDALPSTLGGDDEIGGVGVKSFGDELFRDVGAVGVGGIDEVDAELDCPAKGGDSGVSVRRRSPDAFAGDAHGSVAETVHGEFAKRDGSGCGSGG